MPYGIYKRTKPNPFLGKTHTEEAKQKNRLAHLGKTSWMKGKTHTQKVRDIISKKQKGRKASEATRKKMSEAQKRIGNRPPSPKGKSLSEQHRKNLAISKFGENNPAWKGGITPIHHRIRGTRDYKIWRNAVLERDNRTCVWCFSTENLHADHIKPFSLFPELRFAIDNGRTLCASCHKTTDTWGSVRRNKNE
jgi:5-methylcytosine-specific restriction endonuclease McrA